MIYHASHFLQPTVLRRLVFILAVLIAPLSWAGPAVLEPVYGPVPLPAVAWGVPLAGGPIRVLFVGPSAGLRDAEQLAQRISLKYEVFDVRSEKGIRNSEFSLLAERLAESHDVVVFGNFDFGYIPDAIWETVASQVASGMGLVLAYAPDLLPGPLTALIEKTEPALDAASITRGIGESMTPEWPTNLDFMSARRYGLRGEQGIQNSDSSLEPREQGRIVTLNYPGSGKKSAGMGSSVFSHILAPPLTDPGHARDDYFDVYLSLVAKAVRWAAGREPAAWIAKVEQGDLKGPVDSEVPPDLPDEFIAQMRAAALPPLYHTFMIHFNAPLDKRYRVRAQVREPNRPLRLIYSNLPRLAKGNDTCRIDLPVGPGQYFLDLWILDKKDVVEWHTEIIRVPGWPTISDVAYSKGYLMPNDALTVSLNVQPQLSGGVQAQRPRPCAVYVRAVDSLGRLVSQGRAGVPPDGGHAEVLLAFADLIANLVKVEVFAADVVTPQFTRWDLNRAAYTSLYLPVRASRSAHGFSLVADMPNVSEYNARAILRDLIPFGLDAARAPATDDARYHLAALDLNPIPEVAQYVPDAIEPPGIRKPCLTDPVFRASEAARVRERATPFWAVGSAVYCTGEGNRLGDSDVCLSQTCIEAFQASLRDRYVSLDALNRAWGAAFAQWDEVAPSVRNAVRGTERYGAWLDWRLHMDSVLLDAHARADAAIRAMDADAQAGPVIVDADGPEAGIDWWRTARKLTGLVVAANDIAVETVRSATSNLQPSVYRGLRIASLPDDATARWMPWYAALHGMNALWLDMEGIQPSRSNSTLSAMGTAVSELDSGLGSVLRNAQRPTAPIAVIYSQASRYLRAVNADLASTDAAMSSLMRTLDRLGYAYDVIDDSQLTADALKPYRVLALPAVHALPNAALKAISAFRDNGGCVLADVAPGAYDEHGTRRSEIADCGLRIADFKSQISNLKSQISDSSLSDALRDAGIDRVANLSVDGTETLDGAAYRFDYGTAKLYAFLRAPDAGEPRMAKWKLSLAGDAIAYDARHGRRLSHPKHVEMKLAAGEVFLVSVLPYAVARIRIDTLDSIESGRRLPVRVTVETDGKPAGRHVVHVSIHRKQVQRIAYYDRDIECPRGQGATYIPLALDEQAGSYALVASDALTGVTARSIFEVENR